MKRLTDTQKWVDPWFRRLSPAHKLAWLYILDTCDIAGIWPVDMALFKALSGANLKEAELLKALKGRAKAIPRNRWWIPKFITFQYNQLSKGCKMHVGVMTLIHKNELEALWVEFLAHVNDTVIETPEVAKNDYPLLDEHAEEIYLAYPLLVGKPKALTAIRTALKTEKFETLLSKTKAFAACQPANKAFCPHPASWFNAARYNDNPATWVPKQLQGSKQPDLFAPKKTLIEKEIESLARQAKKLI